MLSPAVTRTDALENLAETSQLTVMAPQVTLLDKLKQVDSIS